MERKSRPEYMSSCLAFSALLMALRRPCTRASTAAGGTAGDAGWKAEAPAMSRNAIITRCLRPRGHGDETMNIQIARHLPLRKGWA